MSKRIKENKIVNLKRLLDEAKKSNEVFSSSKFSILLDRVVDKDGNK